MKLTEEAILLNWAEMNRHRELARILRGIVEKQRRRAAPTSDTNAGSRVTPEQASYAYKQAIAYRNTFSRRNSEPEGPPNATVSDSRRFDLFGSIVSPKSAKWVYLDGSPRTEAACR